MPATSATRQPSALLVSLPWTILTEPSLGLGLLRAVLDEQGIRARVLHLNVFILEHLRAHSYYSIANVYALNDFLFSGVLDPTVTTRQRQWLRAKMDNLLQLGLIDQREHGGVDGVVEELLRLRRETIPAWLEKWADEIASSDATLVGFTCMFDQTIASIALAKLVKERAPDKMVALGGYAVRPPTAEAVLQAFPCVDVVCVAEGEPVIGPLARASAGHLPLSAVPSILYRTLDGRGIEATLTAPAVDLNTCPVPNYEDFFEDLKRLAQEHKVEIEVDRIPVENSRGCWWGQKKHCVFCGIKDSDLIYRHRDATRVLHALDTLAARHGARDFRFSDYILPSQYYNTLLPDLARRGAPYRITCEIKANVNRERVLSLSAAGFDEVQPGVESFSDDILTKMDKGVTGVQNVHTLLMGKRHGVEIRYNILYGLPNDDADEVEKMVRALPRLRHLDPPATRLQIQVTRYAPLQTDPARFGIEASSYEASYDVIFSAQFLEQTGFDLNAFCYYFEIPFENSPRLGRLYSEIDDLVDDWARAHQQRKVELWYEQTDVGLSIYDSRGEAPLTVQLSATESAVYSLMEEPVAVGVLRQQCLQRMTAEEFDAAWHRLDELSLIFHEGPRAIGLALPKIAYTATKKELAAEARAELAKFAALEQRAPTLMVRAAAK